MRLSELVVDPHNSHGVMTRSWVDGDIHDYAGINSDIREEAKPNVPRAKGFNLAVIAFNLDDLFSDWGKQLLGLELTRGIPGLNS